jgi:oligopeptide/dipeptide ABC transporter ATP-binding protein
VSAAGAGTSPLLEFRDVSKEFAGRGRPVRACRGVTFSLYPGEVVGLVGESGSGKSTVANIALGLLPPTRGEVVFEDEPVEGLARRREKALRARMQAVFQEPLLALDGRRTIGWSIDEPLRIHRRGSRGERRERVTALLRAVNLDSSLATRRPSELSGGQLQRVNIARAIALDPSLLVCDEAVSALDVSVQAQILNLFLSIQQTLGLAMLFISHDLAVVRHISDRLVVMYAGQVVEDGPTEEICTEPHHPYTRALLAASLEPDPDPDQVPVPTAQTLRESVPDYGCPFVPRCPLAQPECGAWEPELLPTARARRSACRRAERLVGLSQEQYEEVAVP